MNYKNEIGKRIREAREALDWSQQDLADQTGLGKSRIGNYEQGTRMPGPREATILAAALGSDAAWLMCLRQELNKQELELLRDFRALPERHRNEYARRIKALALAYRESVPDEKLTDTDTKLLVRRSKSTA